MLLLKKDSFSQCKYTLLEEIFVTSKIRFVTLAKIFSTSEEIFDTSKETFVTLGEIFVTQAEIFAICEISRYFKDNIRYFKND